LPYYTRIAGSLDPAMPLLRLTGDVTCPEFVNPDYSRRKHCHSEEHVDHDVQCFALSWWESPGEAGHPGERTRFARGSSLRQPRQRLSEAVTLLALRTTASSWASMHE
jgi:hypothetical protein